MVDTLEAPASGETLLQSMLESIRKPLHVVRAASGQLGVTWQRDPVSGGSDAAGPQVVATLPPIYPEWLGDRRFLDAHRLRFPYVAGEMATGISTPRMVIELGRAQLLGFFGTAGLPLSDIERGIVEIEQALGSECSWGANLIHSPQTPSEEAAVTDLFLRRGVRRVSASAFMGLSPNVVRYACHGLRRGPDGGIVRRNHLFAKISRPEVARQFMSPPPDAMLRVLTGSGQLTAEEATLAAELPLAEDITVEADSGGHTDNRPLSVLLPLIAAERERSAAARRHEVRLGAAGGLGTPTAVAAAFSLGAAYVVTGSINQTAVEAGTSEASKRLLAAASFSDVIMAPAADMFELGVKVQVLRRGTLFAVRAQRLYELYSAYASLEDLPASVRGQLEKDIFAAPLEQIWKTTRAYWEARDKSEIERAEREPKHRMALVFRWYLGQSSRWARAGTRERGTDYQIWCGPAMGAFNAWVAGSFLAELANRTVVQIARNLLEGAAVITRAQTLRSCGLPLPASAFCYQPRPLA